MRIIVNRLPNRLYPDFKRVIVQYLDIGAERTADLIEKVVQMDEVLAKQVLTQTLREFSRRHRNLTLTYKNHFLQAVRTAGVELNSLEEISDDKKMLIGSYLSKEYSISAAAFFNPSMVESPDQTGLEDGSKGVVKIKTWRCSQER